MNRWLTGSGGGGSSGDNRDISGRSGSGVLAYFRSWGKRRARSAPKDSRGDSAVSSLGYKTHQHSSPGTGEEEEEEEEEKEEENRTTTPACWLIS